MDGERLPAVPGPVVVVPVKAFHRAKARLSDVLGPEERSALARQMAAGVVAAAGPLPVTVVCDDDAVASWARSVGAEVSWTPGLGLNGAVDETLERLFAGGSPRAVVAHADLPFAVDLASLAEADPDEVVLAPDRHLDGTNVASVPLGRGMRASYGPGSFRRHAGLAERLGLAVRVVDDEALGWDVDRPGDLSPPAQLGRIVVPDAFVVESK